jgi:hypothetical protein
MAAIRSRSTMPPHIDATPPWPQRPGTCLLRTLEELGTHPSVWDPWLALTPYRSVRRTVDRR